ncbi:RNA-binding transcriptional accessory protein, partial [Streptomyces sp. AC563]|nr:RNA-binding transcriptional accessory protein [Streptomyces buecherae]
RVKVLDVDVPRKRISLTLRLDDEPARGGERDGERAERGARRGAPQQRQRGSGGGGGQGARTGGGQGARSGGGQRAGARRDAAPASGAMADALRRAGLVDPGRG